MDSNTQFSYIDSKNTTIVDSSTQFSYIEHSNLM
jgi:hypothetical protein